MKNITGFLFAALCSMTLVACANSAADIKTAKQARQSGDYETAKEHLEPMAEFGLPEAQVELARVLLANKRAPKADLERARLLLETAASKEYARAHFDLGKLYERGRGVRRNYETAKTHYQTAYDLGYERGLFYVGRMLEKQKKYKAAEEVYIRTYNGKYYKAAKSIAVLYEKGRGHKRDLVTALSWYIAAQRQGVSGLEKKVAKLERILGPKRTAKAKEISEGR
jgi:TPR repeat protein